jgi:hypothetical protein
VNSSNFTWLARLRCRGEQFHRVPTFDRDQPAPTRRRTVGGKDFLLPTIYGRQAKMFF